MSDFTQQPARLAMLAVGGVMHDVLVIRETRGRYQIRLPLGAAPLRIRLGGTVRTIAPDVTTSVPVALVEMR
jgi:hypothetical protein